MTNEASFSQLVLSGEFALKNSDFSKAVTDFSAAVLLKANDPYLIQQHALATYKSKLPTPLEALNVARTIINQLDPEHSIDCKTLGITGAIHKKLWLINRDAHDLAQALEYYGRGYAICKDYYNGENYALCLNLQASIQQDSDKQNALDESAKQVREELVGVLENITKPSDFADRSDRKWVLATMAHTLFALGRTEEALFYEAFLYLEKEDVFCQWERDSYEFEKLQLMKLINSKSSSNYQYLQ